MRVHIVEPYHSHAMQRMSNPLAELRNLWEVTKDEKPDASAEVNIHIPWHSMVDFEGSKNIVAYTHCNPPDAPALYSVCEKADLITCMSFTGRNELIELGIDPKKIWVIYSAADGFKFKPLTIGIVGNPQPNGRKRESLLTDLAWQYSLSAFQFVFIGIGWEDTVNKLQSLGVSAISGTAADGNLQPVYQQFDALLVTGYTEGGSLPILEAMAVGVPVISPKFGYAADLLSEHYSTPDELMTILENMADPRILNHRVARSWSWNDYAQEYALIIARLLGVPSEIYPERAADRYRQILDVISEVKPKRIAEIGTWNGSRAIQMIQEASKYNEDISYQGFDLFDMQTGKHFRNELSKIASPLAVVEKRIKATGAKVGLVKGNTRETLKEMTQADFYFIDGGHSEKTIENDWKKVQSFMFDSEIAIFDDYYHEEKPDGMGCNSIVDNLKGFRITHLPHRTLASDGRLIGMVKVQRA